MLFTRRNLQCEASLRIYILSTALQLRSFSNLAQINTSFHKDTLKIIKLNTKITEALATEATLTPILLFTATLYLSIKREARKTVG